jgi:hypothetical protein
MSVLTVGFFQTATRTIAKLAEKLPTLHGTERPSKSVSSTGATLVDTTTSISRLLHSSSLLPLVRSSCFSSDTHY